MTGGGYGRDSLVVALVEPMADKVGRVLAVRGSVHDAIAAYYTQHFSDPGKTHAGGPRSLVLVGCAVMCGMIVSLSGQIVLRQ